MDDRLVFEMPWGYTLAPRALDDAQIRHVIYPASTPPAAVRSAYRHERWHHSPVRPVYRGAVRVVQALPAVMLVHSLQAGAWLAAAGWLSATFCLVMLSGPLLELPVMAHTLAGPPGDVAAVALDEPLEPACVCDEPDCPAAALDALFTTFGEVCAAAGHLNEGQRAYAHHVVWTLAQGMAEDDQWAPARLGACNLALGRLVWAATHPEEIESQIARACAP